MGETCSVPFQPISFGSKTPRAMLTRWLRYRATSAPLRDGQLGRPKAAAPGRRRPSQSAATLDAPKAFEVVSVKW